MSLSTCGSSYKSSDFLTNVFSNSPEAEASTSHKLNELEFGTCIYSCVHISLDEVFSKMLKKPSIVQKKMIPHMKAFGLFNKMKEKKI